jgi:hypothetical protein
MPSLARRQITPLACRLGFLYAALFVVWGGPPVIRHTGKAARRSCPISLTRNGGFKLF